MRRGKDAFIISVIQRHWIKSHLPCLPLLSPRRTSPVAAHFGLQVTLAERWYFWPGKLGWVLAFWLSSNRAFYPRKVNPWQLMSYIFFFLWWAKGKTRSAKASEWNEQNKTITASPELYSLKSSLDKLDYVTITTCQCNGSWWFILPVIRIWCKLLYPRTNLLWSAGFLFHLIWLLWWYWLTSDN